MSDLQKSIFDLQGKVAVVTGGGGVLCSEMCRALGAAGAKVVALSRQLAKAEKTAREVSEISGEAIGLSCDVLEPDTLKTVCEKVHETFGSIDILINGAGGNSPKATTAGITISDQLDPGFFDLDPEAVQFVFNVNFIGTLLATQIFAKDMVERKDGVIINISSMAGITPLTKVLSYSAAKAAVENFTRWLSVHLAPAQVRVNAIAPGFFLTEQNRFLLTDKDTGKPTPRGETIIGQTPMRRYGTPEELTGALLYLASPASRFVTGTTLAVDGGFSAFSGV